MYKGKRILAIIPARGGSKGIKNKNIRLLNKKPLITYSIDVAKLCSYIDYILVTTDSEKIADISKTAGASVPFIRPEYLASDNAKTIDVLIHAIEVLKSMNMTFDYVVLLQPTQPLRLKKHLDEAIEQIVDFGCDSLVSVCEVSENPILMRTIDESGKLSRILSFNSTIRRQDFPKFYKVNGSIYINKIDKKFNKNTSLNDNEYAYLMPKEYSVDIDEEKDFIMAEEAIKKYWIHTR